MKRILKAVVVGISTFMLATPSTFAKKENTPAIGFLGNTKEAYVTINDVKVITVKSSKINSLEKTKSIAKNLNKLLFDKKLRADRIQPALRKDDYIAKVDESVLFSVEKSLAKEHGISQQKLTLKWVNDVRTALGGKAINYLAYRPNRSLNVATPITQKTQFGYASWYGGEFNGRKTANGDVFNMNKLTAAHRTLPLGTLVLVTNLDTGRSVTVKVNDRGPFADTGRRVLDLSKAAFQAISPINSGVARIRIDVVE